MALVEKLGNYIERLDRPNTELRYGIEDVCGITNTKQLVHGTKANLIGRTFEKFSILGPREFIFNRRTSRNGERISLGFNSTNRDWILTEDYCHFRIRKDKEDVLDPDYLYLFFINPEFDRYARYNSWGSATEFFNWEEIVETPVPIIPIDEQRKTVHDYKVIADRIELLQHMNTNLSTISKQIFISRFISGDEHESAQLRELCEVTSGKRVPKELDFSDVKTNHPYIRVRDIHDSDYICLTDAFEYIDDYTYEIISKYTVIEDDIIVSSVGTVGLIGRVHHSLRDANLTENCFRVRCYDKRYADFIFYALCCYKDLRLLENIIDGSVQAKLPLEKFRCFPIYTPTDDELYDFNSVIRPIRQMLDCNNSELLILMKMLEFAKRRIIQGA